MKKYIDKFISEGEEVEREVNSVSDEMEKVVINFEKLARENRYTIHCKKELIDRMQEILDNLFEES